MPTLPAMFKNLAILLTLSGIGFACDSVEQGSEPESPTANYPCLQSDSLITEHYFHSQQSRRVLRILSDESTGAFQKLEVLNDSDCEVLDAQLLPNTQDGPANYRLAELEYNSLLHFVGISGYKEVFYYQLDSLYLGGPLSPSFGHPVYMEDAQSGQILRLEVWEDFLIGYAEGCGAFVYDLRSLRDARSLLPFQEWEMASGTYHSLFLLPTDNNLYQPIMPVLDAQSGLINLELFFPKPVRIDPDNQPVFEETSPVLKLMHSGGEILEINMESGKAIQ